MAGSEFNPAPYMRWSKRHPGARYNLAGSNLLACTPDELPGLFDGVDYCGDNDDGYPPLVEAIAARYGVGVENVAVASGASGANFLACAALLKPGDDAVFEHPGYDPMAGAARAVGARVTSFKRAFEEGWRVDPERVASAMTDRTRLVMITSPHNPSGVATREDTIHELGEMAMRRGAVVLIDEVYREAVHREAPDRSPVGLAAAIHPACVSVSSLTKSYGLSGLRCGWAIATPDITERIRRARDVVDAVGSYPAEVASARAFDRINVLADRASAIVEPNLSLVHAFIAGRRELEWVEPDAGTVAFPRLRGVDDSGPFVERLLRDYQTAVVPGRFFGAPAHFRIAYGVDHDTLAAGLERIGALLNER